MEKEKERVSKQKKVLQLKEHVARKKEMKKEINQMAYVAWQKNKKIKAVAQKKQKIQDELKRAQEEAAVEVLIRHKKEQKKKARLKQQQLLDKQLLLSMNDFAVSQEKHAMDNVEKKKIKTMKKKLTALLKTPYTDKMTKSLLRGKTPNGVHTRDTMAPQWLMTSTWWCVWGGWGWSYVCCIVEPFFFLFPLILVILVILVTLTLFLSCIPGSLFALSCSFFFPSGKMAAHYDIASDPNSSSSLHSDTKLPHLKQVRRCMSH